MEAPGRPHSAAPQLLAYFCLIQAALLGRGFYDNGAAMLAFAAILCLTRPAMRALSRIGDAWLLPLLVAYSGWLGVTKVISFVKDPFWRRPIEASFVLGAALALAATTAGRHLTPARAVLVAAVMAAVGLHLRVFALLSEPRPTLDTYVIQNEAPRRLLRGQSPYAAVFTLPFAKDRALLGGQTYAFPKYTYLPGTVILELPAALLDIDVRWVQLCAEMGACLIVWLLSAGMPAARRLLILCLILFHPFLPSLYRHGWNEPLVLGPSALTCWLALRTGRARAWGMPVAAGLLLSLKQYLPPLALLLFPAMGLAGSALSALVVAAAVLPIALMDFPGFLDDTVLDLVRIPPRPDSVSLYAYLLRDHGFRLPGALLLALGFAAMLTLVPRLREPLDLPRRLTLYFLCFFFLGKQAFGNYYWLCAGLIALHQSCNERLYPSILSRPGRP